MTRAMKIPGITFLSGLVVIGYLLPGAAQAQRQADTSPGSAASPESATPSASVSASEEGERRWSEIRGVNYIPSYAASSYEIWANYDGVTIRRELAAARAVHFNSVRTWLNFEAFEESPEPFLVHLEDFVGVCRSLGLTVLPILFDGAGADPSSRSENTETVRSAFERFTSRPDAYRLRASYVRFLQVTAEEAIAERLIAFSTDPASVYWGDWSPTPAPDRTGEEDWPRYHDYVRRVIEPFKDDPAIVAWDIMNEPNVMNAFTTAEAPGEIEDFVSEMLWTARAVEPSQPITVGAAGGLTGSHTYQVQVDLVSLHLFAKSIDDQRAEIMKAKKARRGRPLLVTATGAVLFPSVKSELTDRRQSAVVRSAVVMLDREKVGYYLWRLIEGRAMTPWAGLLDEKAEPKSAARWLRRWQRTAD